MRKYFIACLLFAPLAFTTTSCNSDDSTPTEQVNPYDKFKGTWTGTYSGDEDNGTWTATFDHTGKAIGSLVSGTISFDLKGQVSENGVVTATYTYSNNVVGTMTGTMTETTASGEWDSPIQSMNGTWKGTKN